MQLAVYTMIQSCTLTLGNALLKNQRISDLIYTSEKAAEGPRKDGVGKGLFDRKKSTY